MMSTDSTSSANKTWELSLYELNRTPQEAITDSTEIAVSPRSLHNELMCPICLDMLNETMTTKECLHRFCADCIITALRSGNKECPTCRKKLVSKRSLRPDPNFDELIKKIYPSRDEYEAHQERVLQKLSMNHNPTALAHSIEAGLKLQALSRAQRVRKNQLDLSVDAPIISANPSASGFDTLSGPPPQNSEQSTTPPPDLRKPNQLPFHQQPMGPSNALNVASSIPSLMSSAISSSPLAPPPPPPPPSSSLLPPSTASTTPSNIPSMMQNNHLGQHQHHHHHQLDQQRKKQKTTSAEESAGSGADASHESVGEGDGHSSETSMRLNEIELVFKPHPIEDGLNEGHIRYIKTTANATVDHLSRYLMMRLALDFKAEEPGAEAPFADSAHFNIFIASTPGQFSMLNGNMTLDQVNEKYWKVNKPLEMYYSFKK